MKDIHGSILVFAKAPISGKVKTRLLSSMQPERVLSLYKNLILHTLKIAIGANVGSVELWCAPSTDHPFFQQCEEIFQISLFCQPPGDLGKRMFYAINDAFKRGRSFVCLIGTDCPSLTPEDLREAKESLTRGYQAVLSPAEDGGYVLIGLNQSHPALFEGISWGGPTVLQETRERLRGLGWRWRELSCKWDIDRPEDMERLKREGGYDFLSEDKPISFIP